MTLLPASRAMTPARHDRMPYRVFLGQIAARLSNAFEGRANGYQTSQQFRADVQLIADSLRANKGWHAGYHSVRRLLRRIDTFGFHLAALDVRQHAAIHHQLVMRGLDDPAWMTRSASDRHARLAAAIERDAGPQGEPDPLAKRSRGVFEAILQGRHRYGADAVGYYVVSGARDTDDVLAVLLLARWAEAYDKRSGEVVLDVAPMFDSIEAIERSGAIMQRLLADPVYQRHLAARARRQCVLLGYADSSKEGGICASRLAIERAQLELSQVIGAAGTQYAIFHARSGSVALGGGRIDALVRSTPPGSTNGVLRLTEQGEILNQSYGQRPIAMRTLERAFHALAVGLATARRGEAQAVPGAHRECAATLAEASRATYRQLIYGEPAFADYFRQVTPIDVIERMQIGSRPAYREPGGHLEALRPVPWVFAWTQSRHMLPGWYGAGSGLALALERHGLESLRSAYTGWFFLRQLLDDIEAMLARADLEIAQAYNVLAAAPLHRFFVDIRLEYAKARDAVLKIKGHTALLDGDPTLQRSIQLRNPYVDPMNLMQVDLLLRWRATQREDRDLFEALLASISGISQGLQSTG